MLRRIKSSGDGCCRRGTEFYCRIKLSFKTCFCGRKCLRYVVIALIAMYFGVDPSVFLNQRVCWFRQGLESGNISQCNTFKAKTL
jgi:predicted metalloprotease